MNSNELKSAEGEIEKAISHPKTKNNPDTWQYAFLIYNSLLFESDDINLKLAYCDKVIDSYLQVVGVDHSKISEEELKLKIGELESMIEGIKSLDFPDSTKTQVLRQQLRLQELLEMDIRSLTFDLAEAYKTQNEGDSALKYYDKSIEADYKLYACLKGKLEVLNSLSRYEDFIDVLDIASALFPDDEDIALAEMYYLIDKQLFIRARNLLNSYLKFQDTSGKGYLLLGSVCKELNLINESVDAYIKAIEFQNGSFDAFYTIGLHFYEQGELLANENMQMKAQSYLEGAENLEPNNPELLNTLEKFYLDRRDIENYQRIRRKKGFE